MSNRSVLVVHFHPELFQDTVRDRANIIWRVPARARVYPIYSAFIDGQAVLELRDIPRATVREYLCHDRNLHEFRPFAGYNIEKYALAMTERRNVFDTLLAMGIHTSEYMVYEFPRIIHDGTGWLVGFASHYENFIADDVDGDDTEITL
jgi:hypothetical protein